MRHSSVGRVRRRRRALSGQVNRWALEHDPTAAVGGTAIKVNNPTRVRGQHSLHRLQGSRCLNPIWVPALGALSTNSSDTPDLTHIPVLVRGITWCARQHANHGAFHLISGV